MRLWYKQAVPKKKKIEEFEPNMKYGIHNKPLPKYSDNNKEWWTKKAGYEEHPKEVSHLKLAHKILCKNPSDTLYFAQVNDDSCPLEDFKKVHIYNKKQNNYAEKPGNIKKITKNKMK